MSDVPSTIGPYVISRELGRGGMGVVYLARDTRLDRDVAIKALPAELASDPVRLERFEREAKLLAGLSHPNIAGIFGVEERDGATYLVLEYVEGETLADRLDRGPLPLHEALEVAGQIAAGVEAAHEAGVIHRDLKPGNIIITPDGKATVLDFGLARGDDSSLSSSGAPDGPTMTTPQHSPTIEGAILGTAAYMSPEQARGRRVDKRTDIWSFGVVLYECLAGAGPFVGETASDSIGAILHKDVDLDRLPAGTPPMVRHVLGRCLARDKTLRYRDIGDVRLDLTLPADGLGAAAETARPRRLTVPGLALALVLAVAAGAFAWVLKPQPAPEPRPVVNAEIALPAGQRLAHMFRPGLSLAPDGRSLVFFTGEPDEAIFGGRMNVGKTLMLRRMDEPEAVAIARLERPAGNPVLSPDGGWVAYATWGGVHKVSVDGTRTAKLNSRRWCRGMSWNEDGVIVGSFEQQLVQFPAEGGEGETLTTLDAAAKELVHSMPRFLPGGRALLFTVMRFEFGLKAPAAWSIWALDLETRERSLVLEHASDATYVDGSLVFMREGALYGAPFDPETLATTGPARVLVQDVRHFLYGSNTFMETGSGLYDVSASGDLVYARGGVLKELRLTPLIVDLEGNRTPLDIEPGQIHNLRGSPDGRTILYSTYYPTDSVVALHDPGRGVTRPQVRDGQGSRAIWGPGSGNITYDRVDDEGRQRIAYKPVGGSRADETEIPMPDDMRPWISTWSSDGEVLLAVYRSDRRARRLLAYTEAGGWERVGGTGEGQIRYPTFSPDGRWLAFASDESGQQEVLVKPSGRPGGSQQVSVGGGWSPIWSDDGRRIYFRQGSSEDPDNRWVMAVDVNEVDGRLELSTPRRLFRDEFGSTTPIRQWDMLGSDRFLMVLREDEEQQQARLEDRHPDRLVYIQNWASRLGGED
jgi:Tol biopolymer transport system component